MRKFIPLLLLLLWPCITVNDAAAAEYHGVVIRIGRTAGAVEKNVAWLLSDRLKEDGIVNTSVEQENEAGEVAPDELLVLLGIPGHHDEISRYFDAYHIPGLTELSPGPEGFLLRMLPGGDNGLLIAAGMDDRGCLYAVGEILRRIHCRSGILEIPEDTGIRTAPAFEVRGTQIGQSSVARRLAKVRSWTREETERAVLDYALAGANIFPMPDTGMYDFFRSFGLMILGGFGANTAGTEIPPEWEAQESIGRKGYVCLSVPEARQYMLEKCERQFRSSPDYDLVKFHGGDGGGCECDRCNPYGLVFIKLVEEMAGIIHKYHPRTKIYFTNQKFDNEDDNAIFAYLQEEPRDWLWGWGYGPGSDATTWQPGHRQTHRMDLFKYPGFGPYGLYPQEILHQLPPRHVLMYYNEITHWRYAQHAYIQMYPRADRSGDLPPHWSHEIYERRPDKYLTMVYDRRSFYSWPEYYHRVFNDLMRYGVGDITHSSGHHDHFNQWMWQRLLWSPRMTAEEVVDEYCNTWFGPEAAPFIAKALFQLEMNLEEQSGIPLTGKEGIDRYYDLVKDAAQNMSPEVMENSWLWRMYMQKAALDKYIKSAVTRQIEMQKRIISRTRSVMGTRNEDPEIRKMLTWFDDVEETQDMIVLRQEAERLGEESNAIYGVRSEGIFNLEHDYIRLGWYKRQLQRANRARGKEKEDLLAMITDYENSGEGGHYDNLGTCNPAPNVVFGYPYDHGQPYVEGMLSEANLPGQRSMHFTQDEDQGVTLHYRDLDPEARYRVRFTFVRPWYQERYAFRMNQKSQAIYADDVALAKDLELPLQMSDFFSFDIPPSVTRDGDLVIRLERAANVARGDRVSIEQWRNSGGWGTLVSEVWLMKK